MVATLALLGFVAKRREGRFVVGHSGLEPEANGLRVPAAWANSENLPRFLYFLVTRDWDREGREGTRRDSLDTVVVHVMLLDAAWA